jgi:5-methylcytosine-specific restriction endonuclease McrBC regulatory subunit McrC
MKVEVSNGEFFDKFSILEIKSKRMVNENKLHHVNKEKDILKSIVGDLSYVFESSVYSELHNINNQLWDIEDRIREKGGIEEYDEEFIELSRKIYIMNDERFNLKNKINNITSSEYKEQKSHSSCD